MTIESENLTFTAPKSPETVKLSFFTPHWSQTHQRFDILATGKEVRELTLYILRIYLSTLPSSHLKYTTSRNPHAFNSTLLTIIIYIAYDNNIYAFTICISLRTIPVFSASSSSSVHYHFLEARASQKRREWLERETSTNSDEQLRLRGQYYHAPWLGDVSCQPLLYIP
jgi:hypothetical protein